MGKTPTGRRTESSTFCWDGYDGRCVKLVFQAGRLRDFPNLARLRGRDERSAFPYPAEDEPDTVDNESRDEDPVVIALSDFPKNGSRIKSSTPYAMAIVSNVARGTTGP